MNEIRNPNVESRKVFKLYSDFEFQIDIASKRSVSKLRKIRYEYESPNMRRSFGIRISKWISLRHSTFEVPCSIFS
jgi:hypothetical protein